MIATELDGTLRVVNLVRMPWYSSRVGAITSCLASCVGITPSVIFRQAGFSGMEVSRRKGLLGAGGCIPVSRNVRCKGLFGAEGSRVRRVSGEEDCRVIIRSRRWDLI